MRRRLPSIACSNCETNCRARGQRRARRCTAVIFALALGGCSSTGLPPPAYTAPSPPTRAAMMTGLRQAASEAKLTAPVEISPMRKTDRGGLGSYFVCLREVNPASDKRFVYSAFFDDDVYKGAR